MQSNQDSHGDPSASGSFELNGTVQQSSKITIGDVCSVSRDVFNLAAGCTANPVSKKMLEKVGNFVDRKSRLFEGLEKFLPPPIPGITRGPKRLRDKEYIWISEWCTTNGFQEWGMRPRTFVILHMMGCPDAIDGFVEEKQYDSAIPYSEENLPRVIKGSKRKEFISYQQHVLTAHAKDLEYSGRHQNVNGSADDFFWTEKELGSGGFGIVDYVISRQSLRPFARKRIARGRSFKKDRDAIRMFENELKNLKLLSHRHLVQVIGSYTDIKYVGLIMTPVADMDLDVFLSSTQMDPVDRQSCLRRFYGCLATAVEYLHLNQIRHKDIKPKNALVKDRQILLTDFGTSHSWADDAQSTTSGTNKQAFTKAYCAPEVYMHGSRNTSGDIWSLGCVFFDMSTVLAGFSIADRKSFFQNHGTSGLYIRDNEPAYKLWIEELKVQSSSADGNQVLELLQSMCNVKQEERPTATEIVSEILDFEGTPYYGFCCDRNDTHRSSGQDPDNTTTFYDNDTATARPDSRTSNRGVGPKLLLGPNVCCAPPSIQGVENGMKIQDMIPSEESSTAAVSSSSSGANEQQQTEPALPAEEYQGAGSKDLNIMFDTPDSTPEASPQIPVQICLSDNYVSPAVEEVEDGMTIRHLIPDEEELRAIDEACNSNEPVGKSDDVVSSPVVLETQSILPSPRGDRPGPASPLPARINLPWETNSQTIFTCLWPNCEFKTLRGAVSQLKDHLRSKHGTHDISWTALLEDNVFSGNSEASSGNFYAKYDPYKARLRTAITTRKQELQQRKAIDCAQEGATCIQSHSTTSNSRLQSRPPNSGRFEGLPEDLRPRMKSFARNAETPTSDSGSILGHLNSQHIDQLWYLSKEGHKPEGRDTAAPDSSLVPSFFLASKNLFSRQEVDGLTRLRRISGLGSKPLFVCGSLMFPSILKARAETYMTSKGIYSERLQRRLRTNSTDWAKVNISLQHAAETMTPAVIKEHINCKKRGVGISILRRAFDTNAEVSGFLIFGLTEDALTCLDHMFSPEADKDMSAVAARYTSPGGLTVSRQHVDATITVKGSEHMTIASDAFVASGFDEDLLYPISDRQWDINRFVRGRTFRKLSSNHTGEAPWVDEEERLAEAMQIKFILHGDALCDAIVAEEKDKVLSMIDKRVDVNAPCHVYGTALQAAAYKGNEEMADLLLREGARVNAKGGQYQSALIAATVTGHENIANLLLRNGADVLADGGRYISALYQAVDFSDYQLARALLEKGAWLSPDYRELLDLAAEHGSRDMTRLLEEYDVKMLHLKPKSTDDTNDPGSDRDSDTNTVISPGARALRGYRDEAEDRVAVNKAALIKQIGFKVMMLKGQRGKWTGIKGVQIFKAAIQAGMDESIVDRARPHLRMAQNVLDWLMKAVTEANEQNLELEQMRRKKITDGVERGRGNRRRSSGDHSNNLTRPITINIPPGVTRRNTVSDLPLQHYGATPLPTYSSLGLSRNSGGGGGQDASTPAGATDGTICMTCNGRGGRLGTEHNCHVCDGSGRPRRRSDGSRPVTRGRENVTCANCGGRGYVYSDRDCCRACSGSGGGGGGGGGSSSDIAARGSRSNSGAQEDPPPPYTMS